ncbi:MAG: CdaR family protein [Pyrinomonadaceae bacterium]
MNFGISKDLLTQNEQRRNYFRYWLRRIFIDDWLIKLTALGITLALWLGVTGLQTPTVTRLRGVTLNPLVPNSLEITNSPVQEVDLVITGEKRKVDQLNPRDLVVSLDLANVKEGDRTIQITPQNITVDLPSGVKIDEIQPDKVAIKLEKVEEFEVPIRVETSGNPAAGYEIYSTSVTPEKVKVRGPKSFVGSINFVSTEKISVDKQKANLKAQQIPLKIVNPKATLVDAVTVDVLFRIGRKRIERLFVVPYQTATRVGRASVLLYGPNNILEDMTVDDIFIEERREGDTIKLAVVLPSALQKDVEVRSVKYRE